MQARDRVVRRAGARIYLVATDSHGRELRTLATIRASRRGAMVISIKAFVTGFTCCICKLSRHQKIGSMCFMGTDFMVEPPSQIRHLDTRRRSLSSVARVLRLGRASGDGGWTLAPCIRVYGHGSP